MDDDGTKGFWTTIPGILTGVAAVVTALTGLVVAIRGGAPAPAPSARAVAAAPAAPAASVVTVAATTPLPATPASRFALRAVIDDPDGFTNVRQTRSPSGAVLARVGAGEEFETYRQDGAWWEVRVRNGTVGFMHASRIRVLEGRAAAGATR